MQSFFNYIFKLNDDADFVSLINEGAVVVDVRTTNEYKQGHVKNSINIPLDELNKNLNKINKDKPVITVCQSGMRSKNAASFLKKNGYKVYNAGSWLNLK